MKKVFLLIFSVVFAFFAVSCNTESRDSGYGPVLIESFITKQLTAFDGSKMTATNLSALADIDDSRQYWYLYWNYVDDTRPAGPGSSFNAELYQAYRYENLTPSIGEIDFDDPIIYSGNSTQGNSIEKILFDFFPFQITHLLYTGNASENNTYATPQYAFYYDPELIPGESRDTINVHFRFFENKKEGESPVVTRGVNLMALDLQSLEFPTRDGNNEPIEYIVKVNFKCFANSEIPNQENTTMKYFLAKWIPEKPYQE